MKRAIEQGKFDTMVEATDWRYAAAIVGLAKYLRVMVGEEEYEILEEEIRFNSACITEEKYLKFIERYYEDKLHHKKAEMLLRHEEWSEEKIKYVNELLKGNSIMKKIFNKLKFDGTNHLSILEIIGEHRKVLTLETFRNKADMYANFANTNQLLEKGKACCRLLGYYVDPARKSKAIAYNFNADTFSAEDDSLLDFIPFAFSQGREAFFINANYSIKKMISKNQFFENCLVAEIEKKAVEGREANSRQVLFRAIKEVADFIDFDVEVIVKNRENNFFETMFIHKESIEVLKKIKHYDVFCRPYKRRDNSYIDVQKEVMECILNLTRTDPLIDLLLKENSLNEEFRISQLIEVNILICEEGNMKQSNKVAYACAKAVAAKIPNNKRASYRQKLVSAIVFKDYERVNDILLQLSISSDTPFDFAFELFEDFEANKDIAYTFINALAKKQDKNEENGGN
jgi:CRISPR-associated protein Cas8a1/Csx8, subtype I